MHKLLDEDMSNLPMQSVCRELLRHFIEQDDVPATSAASAMHGTALAALVQLHGPLAMALVLRGLAESLLGGPAQGGAASSQMKN